MITEIITEKDTRIIPVHRHILPRIMVGTIQPLHRQCIVTIAMNPLAVDVILHTIVTTIVATTMTPMQPMEVMHRKRVHENTQLRRKTVTAQVLPIHRPVSITTRINLHKAVIVVDIIVLVKAVIMVLDTRPKVVVHTPVAPPPHPGTTIITTMIAGEIIQVDIPQAVTILHLIIVKTALVGLNYQAQVMLRVGIETVKEIIKGPDTHLLLRLPITCIVSPQINP